MPKVSIIIPTYNCAKYLPEAIDSALNQTCKDFEIIVIDDGSTDNTKEIVENYTKRYPLNAIRYFYQENRGLACARNAGVKNSQGSYIALLDADDVWLPDRIKEEVALLEQQKDLGLIHSNIIFISEAGQHIDIPNREKRFLSGNIFEYLMTRKAHISCPTVLVRRECFERLGMFDEYLTRLGCEDRELWLRFSKEYKVAYIDKPLACYRIRKESMSKDTEKMLKARYYVVNKFFSLDHINEKIRKIALAQIHKEIGDTLSGSRRFKESKKEYVKALSFWPYSPRTWLNFTKSLVKL